MRGLKCLGIIKFVSRHLYDVSGTSEQSVSQHVKRLEAKLRLYVSLRRRVKEYRQSHPGIGLRKLYDQLNPEGIGRDKFIDVMQTMGMQLAYKRNPQKTTIPGFLRFPNKIKGILIWKENQVWQTGKTYLESKVIDKYKEPLKPQGINFKIPQNWVECTWDQLSNWVTYGFTKPMPTVDAGIAKITVKHVKNNRIDFNKSDKTSIEAFESLNAKDKPIEGDILITKDGATLGRSAVVPENEIFCIGQSVAVIWLRSTSCNSIFLNRVIQSKYIQDRIWGVARGMGMPHLSITDFRSIVFGLPDLSEQAEIVKRVESLFAKADAIEARYESLKKMIDDLPQAILGKAFRGELV